MCWRIKLHERLHESQANLGGKLTTLSLLHYVLFNINHLLGKNIRIRTKHSVHLKGKLIMKYLTHFKTKSSWKHLHWKDILLVALVPPWVYPLCLGPKQKIICHLSPSRSPGNKFFWSFESKYDILYVYMTFFHFTKKFLSLLTMKVFFRNILPHRTLSIPNDIFYWLLLVDNTTMQIKLTVKFVTKT